MLHKVCAAVLALLICACFNAASVASASQSVTIQAALYPDYPGQPTNLSATAKFTSSTALPPAPVTQFTAYAPAGMREDVGGVQTCAAATLTELGPSGCPTDSRAGFGGGVALIELGSEVVHEPFTIDLFLQSKRSGQISFLAYMRAFAPASIELVLQAHEIAAPKPYGLGLTVSIPPIATIPGAADASIESLFLSIGSSNVAYYETVHGRRTLLHIGGLLAPSHCPSGGFPLRSEVGFADGATSAANTVIPCPGDRR